MSNEQVNNEGLYKYIKEHPSIVISIISGIVIIVGFLFNVLIYMNECRYLEYWHLNKLIISINDKNQLYEMVVVSFMYLTIVLTQSFVSATVSHYQNRTQIIGYIKILLKSLKKEYRKTKKEYAIKVKLSKDKEHEFQLEKEQDKIMSDFASCIADNTAFIRDFRKMVLKNNLINVFLAFAFSSMFLAGIIYLYFAISSSVIEWKVYFITLLLLVAIIWIMPYIGVGLTRFCAYLPFKKKKIEEKVKICKQQADKYIDNKEDYVLTKIIRFELKNYINRESVCSFFIYASIILITFVGYINKSKTNEMINNSTFGIIEYDNFNCAIIYRDDSYIYLEECTISDNEITIFVDKQRRIEDGEICYINREFDNVIRVDLNEEVVK